MDDEFAQYTSLVAGLLWMVHSRPDLACAVSMATQKTESVFSKESLISMSKKEMSYIVDSIQILFKILVIICSISILWKCLGHLSWWVTEQKSIGNVIEKLAQMSTPMTEYAANSKGMQIVLLLFKIVVTINPNPNWGNL